AGGRRRECQTAPREKGRVTGLRVPVPCPLSPVPCPCDRLPAIPSRSTGGFMHVRFCVVSSPYAEEIAQLAREFAAMDPNARRVVVAEEDDYPEEEVSVAIANVANPGAVVLTQAGDVYGVLELDDA